MLTLVVSLTLLGAGDPGEQQRIDFRQKSNDPAVAPGIPPAPHLQDPIDFFETRVRGVLETHCYKCHSTEARKVKSGLLLDSREGLLEGGDRGPAIVPGNAKKSLLIEAVRYGSLEMPPAGKLPEALIADLVRWVEMGAPDPRARSPAPVARTIAPEARRFWSLEPLTRARPPAVRDVEWARNSIDLFVLAKLEAAGLAPAPEASRSVLIRRLSFDLLGLPPAPEQVRAFVDDGRPDAYEKLVDRLLASPHHGERWGQHWLDVVRYAETEGFEYDRHLPGAWRYRDFVVRAFNSDMPYDRFIVAQLAGDELDPRDHDMLIAAGFHRLGAVRRNAGNQAVASSRNEVLTERTDILGAAFLGLTVGCARCHDHKFDPIPQADYYRLQAYLAATRENDVPLASPEEIASWKARRDAVNADIEKIKSALETAEGDDEARLRAELGRARERLPPPLPTICSIRNDHDEATRIHVLRRGDWEAKGERVGMRPLQAVSPGGAPELPVGTPRPRTALARWITAPRHPLTARVIANRIWQHHFGSGIVKTANDFGRNGDIPSHPALLDHLASRLLAGRWRLKSLHRDILLSSTYRQASRSPLRQRALETDPENRLLWKFQRRRLGAEELRDAMLEASGTLNRKVGGASIVVPVAEELVGALYDPSQWTVTGDRAEHHRRSIYLLAKRNLKLPFMEVFDQPALQTSCARRESSTHAPQVLELLNGKTSNELAAAFARRLRRDLGADPSLQVKRAFELVCGRSPTPREARLAVAFLERHSLREFALATFNLHAFLYVE